MLLPVCRLTCPGEFLSGVMGLVYSEPACQSAYDGNVYQLFHLLRKDPTHLNIQEEHNRDTPLIAACRRGNLRVIQYLLDNGADVQLTNKKHRTCLHYVSRRTFSLLDYLMISILMPILLLGYFLMLQKQRHNVSLMKAILSSSVNIDAVDYVSLSPGDQLFFMIYPQASLASC
ncbi:Ankyrin repeat domain-containing protein 22 [Nibea albiflora]|uniref:Ankyrin repeat domain-containing protein 22 n=1 Tax=Nibea albiflora TaxID=240163 RepID=A0ACB7F549_NIBAL|nr:Ankyrin repeat domain-containing protein 22 [Nibea albiflora]